MVPVIWYQLHIGLISFPLQFLQEARIRPFSSRPCAMLEIQPLLDLPLGERPVIIERTGNKRAGICCAPQGRTTWRHCAPWRPGSGSDGGSAPGGLPGRAESLTHQRAGLRPRRDRDRSFHERAAGDDAVVQQSARLLDWPEQQQRLPLP